MLKQFELKTVRKFEETFEECAIREVAEETGLTLTHTPIFLTATSSLFRNYEETVTHHYVTIFMGCRIDEAEPKAEVCSCLSSYFPILPEMKPARVKWLTCGGLR